MQYDTQYQCTVMQKLASILSIAVKIAHRLRCIARHANKTDLIFAVNFLHATESGLLILIVHCLSIYLGIALHYQAHRFP